MSEMTQERQEILEMLAAGKIAVDEAAELLSVLAQPEPAAEKEQQVEQEADLKSDSQKSIKGEPALELDSAAGNGESRPSWLHVHVSDSRTGKDKVKVKLPMRLVRFGLAVGSRYAPELNQFNWDELSDAFSGGRGVLVDVQDEEDGEHVQIFVD